MICLFQVTTNMSEDDCAEGVENAHPACGRRPSAWLKQLPAS
jgi:hypothetical protein